MPSDTETVETQESEQATESLPLDPRDWMQEVTEQAQEEKEAIEAAPAESEPEKPREEARDERGRFKGARRAKDKPSDDLTPDADGNVEFDVEGYGLKERVPLKFAKVIERERRIARAQQSEAGQLRSRVAQIEQKLAGPEEEREPPKPRFDERSWQAKFGNAVKALQEGTLEDPGEVTRLIAERDAGFEERMDARIAEQLRAHGLMMADLTERLKHQETRTAQDARDLDACADWAEGIGIEIEAQDVLERLRDRQEQRISEGLDRTRAYGALQPVLFNEVRAEILEEQLGRRPRGERETVGRRETGGLPRRTPAVTRSPEPEIDFGDDREARADFMFGRRKTAPKR